jgi:quercetin dioxygenase-like cupin family protein
MKRVEQEKETLIMSTSQKKSFNAPDETRTPPNTKLEFVKFGDMTVARMTCLPGWRWSEHIRPMAGTDSCQGTHFSYVISGRLRTRMDDGTEFDIGPGDIAITAPGHDAWVIGDEPFVVLDIQGASRNV